MYDHIHTYVPACICTFQIFLNTLVNIEIIMGNKFSQRRTYCKNVEKFCQENIILHHLPDHIFLFLIYNFSHTFWQFIFFFFFALLLFMPLYFLFPFILIKSNNSFTLFKLHLQINCKGYKHSNTTLEGGKMKEKKRKKNASIGDCMLRYISLLLNSQLQCI